MKKHSLLRKQGIVAVIVFAGAGVAALAMGLLKIVLAGFGARKSHDSSDLLVGLGMLLASTLLLSIARFRSGARAPATNPGLALG